MDFQHKLRTALYQAQIENKRVGLYVDSHRYSDIWGVPYEIGVDYVCILNVEVNPKSSQEDFDLPTASRCEVLVLLDKISCIITDFREVQEEELEKNLSSSN